MSKVEMTRGVSAEGKIISISNVSSGLQDNCFCFDCGARLVARKGEKNEDHFSHYQNDIKSKTCTWGFETELHLLAKELIAENKALEIPIGTIEPISELIEFNSVSLEKRVGNRIPDLIAVTDTGDSILIEIAVSHFCDKAKILEFKESNLNCIEINLSGFSTDEIIITKNCVKNALSCAPMKWLSINNTSDISEKIYSHNKQKQIELSSKLHEIKKEIQLHEPQLKIINDSNNKSLKETERLRKQYAGMKKTYDTLQKATLKYQTLLNSQHEKYLKIVQFEQLIEKYNNELSEKVKLIEKCNLHINKLNLMRAQLSEFDYDESRPFDINLVIERNAEYLSNQKFEYLCNDKNDIIERLDKLIREKQQDFEMQRMKNKSTYIKY